MKIHTSETLATMTPQKALQFLKEGNERFVNNLKIKRNLLDQVQYYRHGQHPFAIVLSCMDSRTSAELIFDQGLGDIFSLRIAGNILNDDIIGSMEYACSIVGSKLIMVLGHSKCGATQGACGGSKVGKLTQLLSKLDVSIDEVTQEMPGIDRTEPEFVEAVTQHNIHHSMDEILVRSSVLKELYDEGKIGLVAAYHHLDTGEVEFLFEDMPNEVVEDGFY
ncbi:MAG: carbonic anhydrase [Bacteroidales bacterium]